jgi:hypothetical protein
MDDDKEKFIYIDKKLCLHVAIKYFKKTKDYENILAYIFFVIEKNIELRQKHLNIITLEAYVDLKGYKLKELDFDFIKLMIQYCQEKYPDNLNIIYVKNANIMVKSLYAIIRPFVDKETRKKIFFIKKNKSKNVTESSDQTDISEQINEENIDELFN